MLPEDIRGDDGRNWCTECTVWLTLYWKTSMCETHERYTDARRLEREHDEAELNDVEGADGQRRSVSELLRPLLGYGPPAIHL